MLRKRRNVPGSAILFVNLFQVLGHVSQAATGTIARPVWPLRFERNEGQADKRVSFIARTPSQTVLLTPNSMLLRLGRPTDLLQLKLKGARGDTLPTGLELLAGTVNYFIGNNSSAWHTDIPTYEKVRYPNLYPGIDLIFYGRERQLEYDFVVGPHSDPEIIGLKLQSSSRDSTVLIAENGDLIIRRTAGEVRLLRPEAYQLGVSGDRTAVDCRFSLRDGSSVGFRVGPYDHSRTLVIDPVLTYSTYFGGSDDEGIFGIQRDLEGNLYIAGETSSVNFPIVDGAQPTIAGGYDGFIAKFNRDATQLVYSTYLGGSKDDHCFGLAVNALGVAYVTGVTDSSDFPTRNAIQDALRGKVNAFVAGLDRTGSQLIFATYLGGSRYESPGNIVLDRESNIYVDGSTQSPDFPVTTGAYQTVCDRGVFPGVCIGDAFVVKMDARGSKLIYSTYLGGSGYDTATDIAVDDKGIAYIGGQTASTDFPSLHAYQPTLAGHANGFITKLSSNGASLVYSTYLGGSEFDFVSGIALDFCRNIYVTGSTSSMNFPTVHPFQAKNNGGTSDGFVAKLNTSGSDLIYSTYLGGSGWDYPFRIGIDLFGSASVIGFTTSTDFPVRNAIQPKFAGGFSDAFITKFRLDGQKLIYSTYLGGSGDEFGYALHLDLLGSVWVGGSTSSKNYPVRDAYQPRYAGGPYDAFLSLIKSTIFEELDALQDLTNSSSENDGLTELLRNVRLSIGSGPVTVTLGALKALDEEIQRSNNTNRAQVHRAIEELSREVRESGNSY